jgi:hypothetical protein
MPIQYGFDAVFTNKGPCCAIENRAEKKRAFDLSARAQLIGARHQCELRAVVSASTQRAAVQSAHRGASFPGTAATWRDALSRPYRMSRIRFPAMTSASTAPHAPSRMPLSDLRSPTLPP